MYLHITTRFRREIGRAHVQCPSCLWLFVCASVIQSIGLCVCVCVCLCVCLCFLLKFESDYKKLTIRSRPLSLLCVVSGKSASTRITVISFHLALHTQTHTHTHTHTHTEVYSHPPTPFQALLNERDSSDATGHRPPSAANEYSPLHHTSSVCPLWETNKLQVCVCVFVALCTVCTVCMHCPNPFFFFSDKLTVES